MTIPGQWTQQAIGRPCFGHKQWQQIVGHEQDRNERHAADELDEYDARHADRGQRRAASKRKKHAERQREDDSDDGRQQRNENPPPQLGVDNRQTKPRRAAQKNERQNRIDDKKKERAPDPPRRVNPQQPDYQSGPDRLRHIDPPAFGDRIRPKPQVIPLRDYKRPTGAILIWRQAAPSLALQIARVVAQATNCGSQYATSATQPRVTKVDPIDEKDLFWPSKRAARQHRRRFFGLWRLANIGQRVQAYRPFSA